MNFLSGPRDLWRFGSLTWSSENHDVYSPIAVKPASVLAPAQITSSGGTGSLSFPVEFGYAGSYTPRVHGLNLPLIVDGFVDNDPTKTFSFRSNNGVTQHTISVPADQLYIRFSLFDALTDGDDDLDMYVYYCGADGASCTQLGESGQPTSEEEFNVFRPAAGLYAVLVHGFATDEVSGGPGGRSWSRDDPQANAFETLMITFPASYFSAGDYQLQVEGLLTAGGPVEVDRFDFRVIDGD